MAENDPLSDGTGSADLVNRAQAGDRAAFETLLRRSQARLQRLAHERLGVAVRQIDETDDLVQSALREAFRDLPAFEYRGAGSFQRWLATIVENKIRHRARALQRDKRRPDGNVELDATPLGADIPARDADPVRDAVTAEVEAGVRAALEQLDADDRDIIVWRQFDGLSAAQLAFLLGITAAAAAKRHLRALQRLRACLAARGIVDCG